MLVGVSPPTGPHPDEEAESPQAKLDRTRREVAAVVAAAHARLPREAAADVGAVYARYSSRFQDSVADQVRTVLDDAVRRKIFVPLANVFYDLGVRGVKDDRAGLNALRACLRTKAARVVLFFATNRLFRKTYRALQFVEEEVVERGVRAIFVKSGVDTDDTTRWRAFLSMSAMMDEFVVTMNVENIRAAQEGLLVEGMVCGTVALGYRGEPTGDSPTRRGRPRHRLVIDEPAADWVRRVFTWYVDDRLSYAAIVRRLNGDPGAPRPPKARRWSYLALRVLLRNARYRGVWTYGATETVWVSSKDYARQDQRDTPRRQVVFEGLRIVDDATWYRAHELMARECSWQAGSLPDDPDRPARSRVLSGLFVCPDHDRRLHVGGPRGQSLLCPDCQALQSDRRPLFTHLPRDLALAKTCEAVAAAVRGDDELVERVVAACRDRVAATGRPDAGSLAALDARLAKLDLRIQFVLRNPGETESDHRESEVALRALRRDRAAAAAEAAASRAASSRPAVVPTAGEVRELLAKLATVLEGAANMGSESAGRVREIIDAVTGGRIELTQHGERRSHRGWLSGRFPNGVVTAAMKTLTGLPTDGSDAPQTFVTVNYRREVATGPVVPSDTVEGVLADYHAGLLFKGIARKWGLRPAVVTELLDADYAARGVSRPDGRKRRSTLDVRHLEEPPYLRHADRVKELVDGGMLIHAIGVELGINPRTVTAAWIYWHTSRGLPAPDGRTRRKLLEVKCRPRVPRGE